MNKINSLIFIIAMALLIPFFGWGIWKEIDSGSDNFQKKLDSNIPRNSVLNSGVSPGAAKNPSDMASLSQDYAGSNNGNEDLQLEESSETIDDQTESEKPKDETELWNTYKDKKGSFEFKHPPEASVTDNGSFITVSQGDKSWKIRIYDNKDQEELEAWFNGYFDEKERKNCVLGDSTVKIGSYETKYADPDSGETTCEQDGYYSTNTEKTKVVKVKIGKETVGNVNKILATFKFAN